MALMIVSTGTLAGSRLRTVRVGTFAAIAAAVAALLLTGGAALGFRVAAMRADGQGAATAGMILDPSRPEHRAVIDRVGALSGRLMRLEGEALRLARQLGLATGGNTQSEPAATSDPAPSGGPFVAPLATPALPATDSFDNDLARLGRELERLEANFVLVAEAALLEDLDRMAFPSRAPIAGGRVSSGFGNRRDPFTRALARHTGIDMPAAYGTPILASAGGRVRFSGYRSAYGRTVEIDHGKGLVTRYGHASRLLVHVGDIVLPGQKIAAVGSSGRSTGPHLHFEVLRQGRQVEPRLYLARSGG